MKQELKENKVFIEPQEMEMPLHNMVAEKGGYIIDELVRGYGYTINEAFKFLIESDYAEYWYDYDGFYFACRFPDEIVTKIVLFAGKTPGEDLSDDFCFNTGKEYWAGWMLTYVMKATSWTIPYITSFIEPEELMDMYYPYQEMDVSRAIDEIIDRIKIQTNKE